MGFVHLCIAEVPHTCCTTVAGAVLSCRRGQGKGKALHCHGQVHTRDRTIGVRNIVSALIGTRRRHVCRRRVRDFEVVVRRTRAIRQTAEVVFASLERWRTCCYCRVGNIVTTANYTISTQPGQAHCHTVNAGFACILRAVKIIIFVYQVAHATQLYFVIFDFTKGYWLCLAACRQAAQWRQSEAHKRLSTRCKNCTSRYIKAQLCIVQTAHRHRSARRGKAARGQLLTRFKRTVAVEVYPGLQHCRRSSHIHRRNPYAGLCARYHRRYERYTVFIISRRAGRAEGHQTRRVIVSTAHQAGHRFRRAV